MFSKKPISYLTKLWKLDGKQTKLVEISGWTSVVLAAYTTEQARLTHHSYLEILYQRVMYVDRDSITFVTTEGDWKPSLGD